MRLFLSVSPLIPRHRPYTLLTSMVKEFCLRLFVRGSTSDITLLRGYFSVHFRYNPDICSPALRRLCRWASEGNVSISPCHPSYMAPAFTMSGGNMVRASLGFGGVSMDFSIGLSPTPIAHVSTSPPLIPDGRIYRVRLAATVFPENPSYNVPRLKSLPTYPP